MLYILQNIGKDLTKELMTQSKAPGGKNKCAAPLIEEEMILANTSYVFVSIHTFSFYCSYLLHFI